MMDIIVEMLRRACFRQDILDNLLMVMNDFIEGVGAESIACLQVDVFAKGEASQVVALHNTVQLRVFLFQAHNARTGENNLQSGKGIVAFAQLGTPIGLFEYLVDEQHTPAIRHEVFGKLFDSHTLKVKVVHVYIETTTVVGTEFFTGILQ